MRIQLHIANYRLDVLSNEGKQLLTAKADNYEFDGDITALIDAFAEMIEPVEALIRASEH